MTKIKKPPRIPNVSEDMERAELSDVVGEIAKWYNHPGEQFGSSSNLKHLPTLSPINSTSRYLTERNENLCQQKDLYKKKIIAPLFIVANK